MRDHDDKAVAAELLQDFHDLNGGFGVEGAGGLVGQDDLGVVHDGARDGHALHLTAGELVRPLFQVFSQTHAGKRFLRAMPALGLRRTRKQQRHLHIRKHRLVRNEVIALEDETHGMVAIRVPVAVAIALGGATVDDKVAARVLVEPADDVEQRGLAAAGLAENAHELAIAKRDGYALERVNDVLACSVVFGDAFELEHGVPLFDDACPMVPISRGTARGMRR